MKKKLLLLSLLLLFNYVAWAQNRQLKGRVTDAQTNETLVGVTVSVKGTATGTATDEEGRYTINLPDNGDVTLLFTYISYIAKEVKVGANATILNTQLTSAAKGLDEVVVIGYGAVKKSDVTGSVASVKAEELKKIPAGNVVEAIQGKVPGVDITRSSGAAGAMPTVTVRGNRSINAGNGPLYIIDGVQYSTIQDISSNDIQSMEVLKDASSTAIYGSKGANGVIIITTKKGVSGKTKVSFSTYAGVSQVAKYPQVMNAQEFIAFKREANRTTGAWTSVADDSKIFSPLEFAAIQNNTYTNFSDLLIHDGMQQDYQVGITAGSEKLRSYISFDYFNEKGILINDNFKRYTGRVNIDYDVNKFLKLGTQTQLTFNNQSSRQDPFINANKITPLSTAYNEDGSVNMNPNNGNLINPLADELKDAYEDNSNISRIFPTIYAELKPLKGLTARSVFSMNINSTRQGTYKSGSTIYNQASGVSEASYINSSARNLSWENILTYQKDLKNHSVTLTGITSYLTNKTDGSTAVGKNQLLSSQLYYGLANTTQGVSIYSTYTGSSVISYAGRLNYGYKSKYLLTLTGRYDGASVLGDGNKWDFFPSVAVAWRPIAENFMKNLTVFSDLKLRGSYGISGNSSVSAYSSQSNLVRIPFGYGDTPAAGFAYSRKIGNPDLNWEKSATTDIGLDIGLANNRIMATVDVYDTRTSDLLYDRGMPPSNGVSVITQNIGKTHNKGIELSLITQNIVTPKFSWTTTLSYFKNNEEVTALTSGATALNSGTTASPRFVVVGSPVNSFYDFEKIGIWQTSELEQAAKFGRKPGEVKIKDQNGDGVIDNLNDRIVLGSAVPTWSGGFNSDLTYKNLEFSFYIYARMGQMINSEYMTRLNPEARENSANVSYWTPENPSNVWPRPDASKSFANVPYSGTLGYTDGSFVKLRSVSLGYSLPSSLVQKLSVQKLKLYVTGKNLFTMSKVKNFDPENQGSLSNPMTRLFVAGVNVEF